MEQVTSLPLSTVEKAGTGDLVSRTTNDVDAVSHTVRFGVPQVLVSVATIALTVAAAVLTSPLVAVALLIGVPLLVPGHALVSQARHPRLFGGAGKLRGSQRLHHRDH